MPADFLDRCLELIDPNTMFFDLPTDKDWQRVEEEFGFEFPPSHKQFVNAFGSGLFGGFELWNPAGKGRFELSMARAMETQESCEALQDMDLRIFEDAGLFLSAERLRLDYAHSSHLAAG